MKDEFVFRDIGRGETRPLYPLRARRPGRGWPEPYPRDRIPASWDGHASRLARLYKRAHVSGALVTVRECEYYIYAGACRDRDGFSMITLDYWIALPDDSEDVCRLRMHHGNNPEHIWTSDPIRVDAFEQDFEREWARASAWEVRVHEPEIADELIALLAKHSPKDRRDHLAYARAVDDIRQRNGCLIREAHYYEGR